MSNKCKAALEDYQPHFQCFMCGEKCPTHGDIACHLVLKCMKTKETYCKLCNLDLHVCCYISLY